ncbi:HNH endonuclease [uncultured Sphingomonas sp.]|uniref:HNH endonuclease n=1 Tax=uncultured Sphingomonas sp. TaxID=158754 RepID=UPI0025D139CA|nr:HNH endonuclease [uncultured Sphingomonas sp.]
MASRIGRPAGDRQAYDRERAQSEARRWYKTAEWQRLREATLLRDHFTCRMCGKGPQVETSQLVADHRTPHRGDRALFFNAGNLWTLCASPCHNKVKQAEERRADA